jgi:hypothetical protein
VHFTEMTIVSGPEPKHAVRAADLGCDHTRGRGRAGAMWRNSTRCQPPGGAGDHGGTSDLNAWKGA